ncbi:MAG: GerMN domain-containing protein [Cyanobacteria bacterium J06627_15]
MSAQKTFDQKTVSPFNWRTLEMYLLALVLGGSAGWGYWWAAQRRPDIITEATPVQVIDLSEAVSALPANPFTQFVPQSDMQPQLYWLMMEEGELILSSQSLRSDRETSPEAMLTTAMNTLLAESIKLDDAFTTIPKGTELLDLSIEPEGIYVDLSEEFATGGGASSMIHRVGQVLYTVTSLDPDAAVYFSVAGQPVDEDAPLGGEGLILQQPVTREAFAKDFSL